MSGGGHKDLHAILGLDEKAGPEELRRAYLSLAVRYHPDRNPGDVAAEERFKDISQAYAVLSDPAARARYERLIRARRGSGSAAGASSAAGRSSGQPGGASGRPGSFSSAQSGSWAGRAGPAGSDSAASSNSSSSEVDLEEILNGFFKSAKGRDLLKDLENELNRAGVKFDQNDFTRWIKNRKGTIAASEAKPLWRRLTDWLTGPEARARKEAARFDINYRLTLTNQAATSGTTVEISYPRDGSDHRLKIRIPGGAKDGSRLRLNGQGQLKPDGGRGDLVLTVQVGPRQSVADLWK